MSATGVGLILLVDLDTLPSPSRSQACFTHDISTCNVLVSLMVACIDGVSQLAIVISAVYWTLILFFPAWILQRQLSASEDSSPQAALALMRIPLKIDLSLHLAPVVTLLADFALYEKKYTKKQVQIGAPLVVLGCGTWYACWVEYCASYNKICEYSTFPVGFVLLNHLVIQSRTLS